MTGSMLRVGLAVALVAGAGCDKQGLHPYGQRTDVVDSCGSDTSVFLRSSPEGTDILIFGRSSATVVVDTSASRCFMSGTVKRDSSTTLSYGTYALDGSGHGVFRVEAEYAFTYEPERSITGRSGAARTDLDPPIEVSLAVMESTSGVRVGLDGVTREYTALDRVIGAIDLEGPTGIHDVYQLFNLALFFSQVRVPAFGGVGMTRYLSAPGTFQGLVTGQFTLSIKSLLTPTVTIDYQGLEDFPGIWIDGAQITEANLSGNGPMRGALSFDFRDSSGASVYAGAISYEDLTVQNGVAHSGAYGVTVYGSPDIVGTVPYTVASDVDLTNIVPITP